MSTSQFTRSARLGLAHPRTPRKIEKPKPNETVDDFQIQKTLGFIDGYNDVLGSLRVLCG
jgi:hypothetical protein